MRLNNRGLRNAVRILLCNKHADSIIGESVAKRMYLPLVEYEPFGETCDPSVTTARSMRKTCSWSFDGTFKSFDDYYDFNKSTHRGWLAEILTALGRNTPGKSHWIEIRGEKPVKENGTIH